MENILHLKLDEISDGRKNEHDEYEYFMNDLIPQGPNQCTISLYKIPPEKSAYPFHYHNMNEEAFYIISGEGMLRTQNEEKAVSAGDFLFFPANEKGAHKLVNTSKTEMLVYLDFDTNNKIDVTFYPDSKKIGIWGGGVNQLYKEEDKVGYYEGE